MGSTFDTNLSQLIPTIIHGGSLLLKLVISFQMRHFPLLCSEGPCSLSTVISLSRHTAPPVRPPIIHPVLTVHLYTRRWRVRCIGDPTAARHPPSVS